VTGRGAGAWPRRLAAFAGNRRAPAAASRSRRPKPMNFPCRGKACIVENVAPVPGRSTHEIHGGMAGPGFFYAPGSARKKLRQKDDRNPGRSSSPGAICQRDRVNANVSRSDDQRVGSCASLAGSFPSDRALMSMLIGPGY
jgi:hypothetical protein